MRWQDRYLKKMIRGLFLALVVCLVAMVVTLKYAPKSTYALDEHNCLACHGSPRLSKVSAEGDEISLYVDEEVLGSAHRYIDCTTCHTSAPHEVATPLTKLSLAEKCGTCHQYQYKLHLKSIHGEQLTQGNPDVATCVDCHSSEANPHSIDRVLEYDASAYKKNISETCAKCHGNEELMARYGIVEKVYESYMRSFHGKAIQLGTYEISQLDKATCVNCHGTHDIQSVTNPGVDSPVVGMENLAQTCEQCHPGAGVEFASGFMGHKEASPETFPIVHYTEKFFIWLTAIVVAFGILLVLLAASRRIGKREKGSE